MTLKGDAEFKRKLTRGLKNDIRNLVNFYASSQKTEIFTMIGSFFPKSETLHYDWLLFSKAYKELDEEVHRSYVS